jgi:hypothetical protein
MDKKTQATVDRMHSEMVEKYEVTGKRSEVKGADVCRCQCESGGACSRTVCSGAAALARDVRTVADQGNGANWQLALEKIRELCGQELEAAEETPLKRAAGMAMDFVALVGTLSDEDAVKAVEVIKSAVRVQLLARQMKGKAVARA